MHASAIAQLIRRRIRRLIEEWNRESSMGSANLACRDDVSASSLPHILRPTHMSVVPYLPTIFTGTVWLPLHAPFNDNKKSASTYTLRGGT